MELFSILYILIGLALGYFVAHSRAKSNFVRQISRLEERNSNLSSQLEVAGKEQNEAIRQANEAERQMEGIKADYRNLKERFNDQKEEMQDLQKRFKDEFENLANKILEEKSQKFTEQNHEKLNELLKPLGEKMEAFKKKVEETYEKEMREQVSLKEQIRQMSELNKNLTEEAKSLTRALRNDSKTQGRWGEVILQRILEKSGLTEGREYETQVGVKTREGGQQILDVVVRLPDEKNIIIDSKVSLKAFNNFIEAEDEAVSREALKDHIRSLRNHVKNLGSKNYQHLFADLSPDFVLMFVPVESAFGLALQHDGDLYYEAFEKNIVIVSPSTLLATLATIDSVWKQEYQSKNAREIAYRGGKLYDKFVNFAESLQKIGERIQQSREAYDAAMGQLSTGHGNVVRQVEMLRKLGAQSTKKMPQELTEVPQVEDGNSEIPSETNGTL